jgi:hypothetical protein
MKATLMVLAAMISLPPQQATPPAAQPPRPAPPTCEAAEHRQFDFWIGDWSVTVSGKPAGTNRIELAQKGCVLIEHWTGAGGNTGTSLNFYDRRTRQWHQVWIDSGGNVLRLAGGLQGEAMVMSSATVALPNGTSQTHRITWSKQPEGAVRQHWEVSPDNGKTWTTSFDGMYRKR